MRNEYKVSRGRDGTLFVRRVDVRSRSRFRAGFLAAVAAMGLAAMNYSSAAQGISSLMLSIQDWLAPTEPAAPPPTKAETLSLTEMTTEKLELPLSRLTEQDATGVSLPGPPAVVPEQTSVIQPLQSKEPPDAQPPEPSLDVHTVTIAPGDSLSTIFLSLELNQAELLRLTNGEGKPLKRIHPGQALEFHIDSDKRIRQLVYRIDDVHSMHFVSTDDGYRSERKEEPYDSHIATVQGTVKSSLFLAGQASGLSDRTIMEMVEILAWDVDFALDIRSGDHFSIVYEELHKDGRKVRDGPILAAEFVNRGRSIRALRYTDSKDRSDYFSPTGESMRKAFLRTPVKFSRISSRFNLRRKHPVLHTIRAHRGVDYAAPTGTPVKSTGDGKIVFAGRKGGYGRAVIVRHGSTYTTLYAHLSKFTKRARAGRSVSQGQIIGYVGSTGLATGPHLHYEFQVRGRHRNPLKVELPKAPPIAAAYKADFLEQTRSLVTRLDLLSRTQLAVND